MIKKIRNKFFNLFRKREATQDIRYEIEGFKIRLPHSHKLPEYQNSFKNYDRKLKSIIGSINKFQSINNGIIIDIGANVGDTAALIRSCTTSKIFCIEGDRYFLEYLHKNTSNLSDIVIIESFIRGINNTVYGEIINNNGTSRIKSISKNIDNGLIIQTKRLQDVLKENNIELFQLKLIKIDTDGFDFGIILDSKELITSNKPNLYFEYDIGFNDNDMSDSLEIISILEKNGYYIIVYDNFGNLLQFVVSDYMTNFMRLNHYLKSCRRYGGGIYYFDLFATVNLSIAEDIIRNDD